MAEALRLIMLKRSLKLLGGGRLNPNVYEVCKEVLCRMGHILVAHGTRQWYKWLVGRFAKHLFSWSLLAWGDNPSLSAIYSS